MRQLNAFLSALFAMLIMAMIASCNKDETFGDGGRPQIVLDSPTGVYEVRVGGELTIEPEYVNASGARYCWTIDGQVVATSPSYTAVWQSVGTYYIDLTVTNGAGSAKEQIRVDVVERLLPGFSLALPSSGTTLLCGEELALEPEFRAGDDDVEVTWKIDDEIVASGPLYVFKKEHPGEYRLTIEVSNIDGATERTYIIKVVDQLPLEVELDGDVTTWAGLPVDLKATVGGCEQPEFAWSVDGRDVACSSRIYEFAASKAGDYRVTVKVTDPQSGQSATATTMVKCLSDNQMARARVITASSSAMVSEVCQWLPAPGQFIGETSSIGGMSPDLNTQEAANRWALRRLQANSFVSLGGYGGMIILGFDHSILATDEVADFAIMGNPTQSSNEPGIVWVSQDVNGNGIADDPWYMLKGSDEAQPCEITYYKPSAPQMNVVWTTGDGSRGAIAYLPQFHTQPYYYPAWVSADSYTLTGYRLAAKNYYDEQSHQWVNPPYGWGYVDNVGSDALEIKGRRYTGFKISNAVTASGASVNLKYVDFIKVQTAVCASSSVLGELSTEVCGVVDYSMMK